MSSESSQVRLLLLIHAFEGKKMREGDDLFYLFGRKRTKKKKRADCKKCDVTTLLGASIYQSTCYYFLLHPNLVEFTLI